VLQMGLACLATADPCRLRGPFFLCLGMALPSTTSTKWYRLGALLPNTPYPLMLIQKREKTHHQNMSRHTT